jgi:3-oxoacyl-[acyl-carrier-protein] synthase II
MPSLSDQVSISGIGVLSPLGAGPAQHRCALERNLQARTLRIEGFRASDYIKRRYLRPLDDVTLRCIAMSAEAIRDAGVAESGLDPSRIGVVLGSMYAGIGCIFNFKQACFQSRAETYLGLSPLYFPGIVFNSLSGQPAIELKYTGPNAVVNAGFTSGLLAVIKGIEYIRSGQADVVIAGGAEMHHPYLEEKYERRHADPRLAAVGSGFKLSEAVCLFVMHRADDARFGSRAPYASVCSWRCGFLPEGYRGDGLAKALSCMSETEYGPVDTLVTCSCEGSPMYEHERASIDRAFTTAPPRLLGNKGNFGHTLGASGALNLLQGLLDSGGGSTERRTLVNSLDPNGNFALLSVRRRLDHD